MSEQKRPHNPPVTRDHRRQWRRCLYVYPVISRRAKGLSIGVNLNPDKQCNYACVYCQINRRISRAIKEVDIDILRRELAMVLSEAVGGDLWSEKRFAATPPKLRRINDIAFSGDGEPTCLGDFDQAVAAAAEIKSAAGCDQVKIVVITNASQLQYPQFQRALPILDANNGEIWAKLDAGTDEYFQRINRPQPKVHLDQIVENIIGVARGRPVVIQTLFCRLSGQVPPADEVEAYCARLGQIVAAGGKIKAVQVHTVARRPAEEFVSALSDEQLDRIAQQIRLAVSAAPVETYYGADVPAQTSSPEAQGQ